MIEHWHLLKFTKNKGKRRVANTSHARSTCCCYYFADSIFCSRFGAVVMKLLHWWMTLHCFCKIWRGLFSWIMSVWLLCVASKQKQSWKHEVLMIKHMIHRVWASSYLMCSSNAYSHRLATSKLFDCSCSCTHCIKQSSRWWCREVTQKTATRRH